MQMNANIYTANWKVCYMLLNNALETWVDAMERESGEWQIDLTPARLLPFDA